MKKAVDLKKTIDGLIYAFPISNVVNRPYRADHYLSRKLCNSSGRTARSETWPAWPESGQ